MKKTKYEHVALDDKGVPIIVGTNMKVIEIVLEKTAYGWRPEELYFQHPHLTLGQIYSALLDRATELGRVLFTHDDDLLAEATERLS
ncbi:MAG: DUF433 domain-containing protein [Deltaproteobacteria bacterium]|nr:DUF433 domain-containing protein [Deltaproteobacteria bacterium]